VVEAFTRSSDTAQREADLMKAVPDMDLINAMLPGVKVSMPGLLKMKMADKADKKKGKGKAK
jgi:hypothetical protein